MRAAKGAVPVGKVPVCATLAVVFVIRAVAYAIPAVAFAIRVGLVIQAAAAQNRAVAVPLAFQDPNSGVFRFACRVLRMFTFWGGVQGFRGPRDFVAGAAPTSRSDSNFGFHEGLNISGRAPIVGRLFPQLSYQLGFQAFQSRLSGTVDNGDDRGQQFITAGLYRRVCSGVQFGLVYDYMNDDLDEDMSLSQIRYEVSLKESSWPRNRLLGSQLDQGLRSLTE